MLKRIAALRNTRRQLLSSTLDFSHSRPLLFVSSIPLCCDIRFPLTSISISLVHQQPSPSRDPNIAVCCFDAPTARAVTSCHLATEHETTFEPLRLADRRLPIHLLQHLAISCRPLCLSTASAALPPPDLHSHEQVTFPCPASDSRSLCALTVFTLRCIPS
jgi:hypothetical protein